MGCVEGSDLLERRPKKYVKHESVKDTRKMVHSFLKKLILGGKTLCPNLSKIHFRDFMSVTYHFEDFRVT